MKEGTCENQTLASKTGHDKNSTSHGTHDSGILWQTEGERWHRHSHRPHENRKCNLNLS